MQFLFLIIAQGKKMNIKFCMMTALLGLGLISASGTWAASCGGFTMNADAGSTGSITCTTNSGNIHYQGGNNVVESPSGNILFSGVTDLTSNISGVFNDAPKAAGFGTFNITPSVWDTWDSIFIALKQGNGYGLFELTEIINSGTWQTPNGNSGKFGTGLSHYIAFGGDPSTPNPVPVPAAVWLFGSALLGLVKAKRKSA